MNGGIITLFNSTSPQAHAFHITWNKLKWDIELRKEWCGVILLCASRLVSVVSNPAKTGVYCHTCRQWIGIVEPEWAKA